VSGYHLGDGSIQLLIRRPGRGPGRLVPPCRFPNRRRSTPGTVGSSIQSSERVSINWSVLVCHWCFWPEPAGASCPGRWFRTLLRDIYAVALTPNRENGFLW